MSMLTLSSDLVATASSSGHLVAFDPVSSGVLPFFFRKSSGKILVQLPELGGVK